MLRKHKKFSKPRQIFDSTRIEEENKIVEKYGLKTKREIWKAKAKLDIIRNTAKKVIYSNEEEQVKFLNKLNKLGFNVKTAVDVLSLTEEDILKRRLQTVLVSKKLATTPKGARQLITHKHVVVGDRIVNIPSYMVNIDEEGKIRVLLSQKPKKEIQKATENLEEEIENE